MGNKKAYRKSRSRKKKFYSNQFSTTPEVSSELTEGEEAETPLARPRSIQESNGVEEQSTSVKKLRLSDSFVKSPHPTNDEENDGFVIISMAFLQLLPLVSAQIARPL